MKKLITLLFCAFLMQSCAHNALKKSQKNNTVLNLDGNQSMCITGKGIGQDAAINPYKNEDSFAIVKNIGKTTLSVRIQNKGKIADEIAIKPKETKKIVLLKNYELYLDSESVAKAAVSFVKS